MTTRGGLLASGEQLLAVGSKPSRPNCHIAAVGSVKPPGGLPLVSTLSTAASGAEISNALEVH
jgi:hypothetical protein